MSWMWRALAGPLLWAGLFVLVYALHGAGCHLGWQARPAPLGDWHHLAMGLAWGAGLVLHAVMIATLPTGSGRARQWVTSGTWIGFVSTLVTLFPVVATSTCLQP